LHNCTFSGFVSIVLYSSIYIVPLNSRGPTEVLFVRLTPRKERSFKDKEVERLDDKKEAPADCGRQFQREEPATEKENGCQPTYSSVTTLCVL